ncbi:hypothetical protein BDW22DRAFT_1354855 [Trametopsis cervina]|nr:hypothetical protein BDW22DRAFT_1354855 [Trametopsis cervina]
MQHGRLSEPPRNREYLRSDARRVRPACNRQWRCGLLTLISSVHCGANLRPASVLARKHVSSPSTSIDREHSRTTYPTSIVVVATDVAAESCEGGSRD